MTEMWTVKQAAQVMGCHEATIRRMIGRGQLPATKIGSTYRIRPSDLEPTTVPAPERKAATPREPVGRFSRLVRGLAGTGGHSDRG